MLQKRKAFFSKDCEQYFTFERFFSYFLQKQHFFIKVVKYL